MTKHNKDRYDIILREATALFSENGYSSTTVRQIAERTGIKSGSLFHHFSTKEEILFIILKNASLKTSGKIKKSIEQGSDCKEQLRNTIRVLIEVVHEDKVFSASWSVLNRDARHLADDHRKEFTKIYNEGIVKVVQDLIIECKKQGLVKTDPLVLTHLISDTTFFSIRWFKEGGRLDLDQLSEQIFLTVINNDEEAALPLTQAKQTLSSGHGLS
jgi:AcrR family transcriptional regulator